MRIGEIASGLQLNKTTVYRLLGALEKLDLVKIDPEHFVLEVETGKKRCPHHIEATMSEVF